MLGELGSEHAIRTLRLEAAASAAEARRARQAERAMQVELAAKRDQEERLRVLHEEAYAELAQGRQEAERQLDMYDEVRPMPRAGEKEGCGAVLCPCSIPTERKVRAEAACLQSSSSLHLLQEGMSPHAHGCRGWHAPYPPNPLILPNPDQMVERLEDRVETLENERLELGAYLQETGQLDGEVEADT